MEQNKTTPVLVMGIISLALSFTCVSVAGIILGAITMSKANSYTGEFSNKVAIGKRLGLAGLIVGIIFTVMYLFILIGIIPNS